MTLILEDYAFLIVEKVTARLRSKERGRERQRGAELAFSLDVRRLSQRVILKDGRELLVFNFARHAVDFSPLKQAEFSERLVCIFKNFRADVFQIFNHQVCIF